MTGRNEDRHWQKKIGQKDLYILLADFLFMKQIYLYILICGSSSHLM